MNRKVILIDFLIQFVSFIANLSEIAAGGIAVYLFAFKGKAIKSMFNLLLNYSFQLTLNELKGKLDKLLDLKAGEPAQHEEILNVFHDIVGQLRGNPRLYTHCEKIIERIIDCTNTPKKMTEGLKRGLVSELKEQIRSLDIQNYDNLLEKNND